MSEFQRLQNLIKMSFDVIASVTNPISPTAKTPGKVNLTSPWPTRANNPKKLHSGIDLGAEANSEIAAVEGGKIDKVFPGSPEEVSYIKIGNVFYKHVAVKNNLKEGDKVKAGDIIGKLDDTGKEAKPDPLWGGWHLHFQGKDPNPIEYLMKLQLLLVWHFFDDANEDYVKNKHEELYNKMRKVEK